MLHTMCFIVGGKRVHCIQCAKLFEAIGYIACIVFDCVRQKGTLHTMCLIV